MDQFQCCHLTKAMIPTKYIEHLHLQIVHMVTVVLLLLQVLLSIFSMHTFQLLFSVSLFVVPLRQVLYLLHPFFLYDLSHAERAETTDPPQFLSLTWHFGEQCQRDRPGLPEIMLDYTNLLMTCDLYSSLELASYNAICRCAQPHDFVLLLEFGPSPIWARAMLQIYQYFPSDSCSHRYDSRTKLSRHLYVMEV